MQFETNDSVVIAFFTTSSETVPSKLIKLNLASMESDALSNFKSISPQHDGRTYFKNCCFTSDKTQILLFTDKWITVFNENLEKLEKVNKTTI